jgi:hypothetical protein
MTIDLYRLFVLIFLMSLCLGAVTIGRNTGRIADALEAQAACPMGAP